MYILAYLIKTIISKLFKWLRFDLKKKTLTFIAEQVLPYHK